MYPTTILLTLKFSTTHNHNIYWDVAQIKVQMSNRKKKKKMFTFYYRFLHSFTSDALYAMSACTCYRVCWCIDYQYDSVQCCFFLTVGGKLWKPLESMHTLSYSGWIPHDTVIRYCVFVAFFLNVQPYMYTAIGFWNVSIFIPPCQGILN